MQTAAKYASSGSQNQTQPLIQAVQAQGPSYPLASTLPAPPTPPAAFRGPNDFWIRLFTIRNDHHMAVDSDPVYVLERGIHPT